MAETQAAFSGDSDPSGSIFLGVRFVLFGFGPSDKIQYRDALVSGGGFDVGRYDLSCTHVIVHRLTRDDLVCVDAYRDGKFVVTELWVKDSLDLGNLVDATRSLYMPVKDLNGVPGFQSLCICVTGYQKQERSDIMKMVELLGAQFTKALVITKVTHLICYKFEGQKYLYAKRLGITLVNHRWLEDSLRAWDILPENEYSKSSWELEILDVEVGDSEEETEKMCYIRSVNQRRIDEYDGNENRISRCAMAAGETFEVRHNNDGNQVSSSKSNKVIENDPLLSVLRKGTPDKRAVDGKGPDEMLDSQNFGAFLMERNGPAVDHIFDGARNTDNCDKSPGFNDGRKVAIETNVSKEAVYSDASYKRTPPGGPWSASKKSSVSYFREDPSTRLNILHQSSCGTSTSEDPKSILPSASEQIPNKFNFDEEIISGKKDPLSADQVHVMLANGVASPKGGYCNKAQAKSTKCKSMGSERESSYNETVDAHIFTKSHLESSTSSKPLKIPSAQTAQDIMTDLPKRKFCGFSKMRRTVSSFGGLIDTTGRLIDKTGMPLHVKVAGLPIDDLQLQTAFSDRMDLANMVPVEADVAQGGDSLEMNCNPAPTKSLGFIDSGYLSNQTNEDAEMSKSSSINGLGNESGQPNQGSEELLYSDHSFSSEKFQHGVSAEACQNGKAEMKGCSAKNSSSRLTEKLVVRKNAIGRSGLSAGKGATTKKVTIGAEERLDAAAHELLEGTENLEMDLIATTCKVLQVDRKNDMPSAQGPLNKTKKNSAVMDENGSISDAKEKHSTGNKQQKTEGEIWDGGKNVSKLNQVNIQNDVALKSADGQKNIVLGSTAHNMQHADRKTSKLKVQSSSSKLKRKTEAVGETDLDADKENRPTESKRQNMDDEEHTSKKIVSKFMQAIRQTDSINTKHKVDGSKVGKISTNRQSEPQWFILSGHHLQRKEFQQVIKSMRGKICRDSHHWCYQATHFIVPDPVRRTEKFFAAAAAGRWILKTDYLTASSEAGKFLAEEPFEWYRTGLNEDGAINLEAPRKWRLLRQRTGHGAFHGMNIIIYGECIAPSLDTLKRVVKAGDGFILATSPPYHRFLKSGVDFAIVSPGMPRVDAWIQEFISHNVPCVLADYLVEFVCKPGFSLDRHVLYNMHAAAEKSQANLLQKLEEVVVVPTEEDDIVCSVCNSGDSGEVMLICGDEAGRLGCGVATHIYCCDPSLDSVPESNWFCSKCSGAVLKKSTKKRSISKGK